MLCHLVCSHQDKVIFPLDFQVFLKFMKKLKSMEARVKFFLFLLKKKKKELRDLSESFDGKDLLSSTWKAP